MDGNSHGASGKAEVVQPDGCPTPSRRGRATDGRAPFRPFERVERGAGRSETPGLVDGAEGVLPAGV